MTLMLSKATGGDAMQSAMTAVIVHLFNLEGGSQKAKHYSLKAGVTLDPAIEGQVSQVADAYHAAAGADIVVTSGTRSADSQASAMYRKLASGENIMRLYRNQTAAGQIRDAYTAGVAAGKSSSAIITDMTSVISNQISNNVYISAHLRAGAVDVRMRGMSTSQMSAFRTAASGVATTVLKESDHWHLQF